MRGRIERVDDVTIHISELPLKKWTQDYKQFLEEALTSSSGEGNEKSKEKLPKIKDFKENHTDTTVSFTITAEKCDLDKYETEKGGLLAKFKLAGSISTSNMHFFDTDGVITKYQTPEAILIAFYHQRLDFYGKRKALLLQKLRREQRMLSNKARFVEEVCSGDLIVSNRKRAVILAELKDRGYDLFDKDSKAKTNDSENDEDDEEEGADFDANGENLAKGYEYLLGMKIWSLTFEKAEELRNQLGEKTKIVANLEATTPSQIWQNDLEAIEEALEKRDEEMTSSSVDQKKAQAKSQKQQAKTATKNAAAAKRTKSKKKTPEWNSDLEDSDDESVIDMESDMEAPLERSKPKQRLNKVSGATTGKLKATAAPSNGPLRAEGISARNLASNAADDGRGDEPEKMAKRTKSKMKTPEWTSDLEDSDDESVIDMQSDIEAPLERSKPNQRLNKVSGATTGKLKATAAPSNGPLRTKGISARDLASNAVDDGRGDEPEKMATKISKGKKSVSLQVLSSDEEFAMDTSSIEEVAAPAKKEKSGKQTSRALQSQKSRLAEKPASHESKKAMLVDHEEEVASDSESEVDESLMERMEKKRLVSPPSKKGNGTFKSTVGDSRGIKRPSSPAASERSHLDDFDSLGKKWVPALPPVVATKKAAQPKPLTQKVKATTGASKKQATAKGRAPAKRKTYDETSSSDSDDFEVRDDSDAPPPSEQPPSRARAVRARKQVKYVLSDDDESNHDSDSSAE